MACLQYQCKKTVNPVKTLDQDEKVTVKGVNKHGKLIAFMLLNPKPFKTCLSFTCSHTSGDKLPFKAQVFKQGGIL